MYYKLIQDKNKMNYYKDKEGIVHAVVDLNEFWRYHPNTYLIPATYDEFCEYEKIELRKQRVVMSK
jgi:hypothetical protein